MKIEQLEKASATYYAGNPIMTDAEFDAAIIDLRKDNPNHPFLKRIGAPVPGKEKVEHKIPMGSLDNANNEKEFVSWIPEDNPYICLSHKLDGSSLELIYQDGSFVRAITRGDGEVGEDVTKNVLKSGNVPLSIYPGIISVRCECLIHKDDWAENFKGDANPRNSAAGTLRRYDGHNAKYLRFYAFDALFGTISSICRSFGSIDSVFLHIEYENDVLEMLAKWFHTPINTFSNSVENLIAWYRATEDNRDIFPYEIDGIVAKIDDRIRSQEMGVRDGRPKGQIAIKFTPRGGETILNDVVWQVGQTGALTPVGEVSPVGVGGTVIRRVTLCNIDEIIRLGIAIGDTVEVVRAGDVIPKLSRLVSEGYSRKPICFPKKCPECGCKTKKDGARLFCQNDECPGQSLGRIMTWIKKRNILNLGEGIVKAAGVERIDHLYVVPFHLWVETKVGNGILGEKRAKKIMDSLGKSKSVSLPEFLGSIGIKGVGRSLATDLCNWLNDIPNFGSELTLDDILMLEENLVAKCEGFGETRARDFCNWILEHTEEILDLANIMHFDDQPDTKGEGGVFDGETICFTGKSPRPRSEMSRLAESAGASVSNSINSSTTILVMSDKHGLSNKAMRARRSGIKLITSDDFLSQIGV